MEEEGTREEEEVKKEREEKEEEEEKEEKRQQRWSEIKPSIFNVTRRSRRTNVQQPSLSIKSWG